MLNLWKIYLEKTLKQYSLNSENGNDDGSSSEDVMIKVKTDEFSNTASDDRNFILQIVRVIANIVINPEVGKAVNEHYGMQLVNEFLKVLISNPFKKNEELVLSILSTLNNLSYYYTTDVNAKQTDILDAVTEYSQSDNKECVVETMRILGNLSRSNPSRNYIVDSDIFNILFKILHKGNCIKKKTRELAW